MNATAAIALKGGSKARVGDRPTIGRWNVFVIAGRAVRAKGARLIAGQGMSRSIDTSIPDEV